MAIWGGDIGGPTYNQYLQSLYAQQSYTNEYARQQAAARQNVFGGMATIGKRDEKKTFLQELRAEITEWHGDWRIA